MIHAPNGMQLTELSETPKMKCNKRNLISGGGMRIPTLTGSRWIYKVKQVEDGSVEKYKS